MRHTCNRCVEDAEEVGPPRGGAPGWRGVGPLSPFNALRLQTARGKSALVASASHALLTPAPPQAQDLPGTWCRWAAPEFGRGKAMGERTGCGLNPAQKHTGERTGIELLGQVRHVIERRCRGLDGIVLGALRAPLEVVSRLLLVLVAGSPNATPVSRHRSPVTSRSSGHVRTKDRCLEHLIAKQMAASQGRKHHRLGDGVYLFRCSDKKPGLH